jgi:hypothetical protein
MEINLGTHIEETIFTIIVWVGIWGITEHVVRIYSRGIYSEILAYAFLVIFGFFMLCVRGHFNKANN